LNSLPGSASAADAGTPFIVLQRTQSGLLGVGFGELAVGKFVRVKSAAHQL
jgi:hypothetical protein